MVYSSNHENQIYIASTPYFDVGSTKLAWFEHPIHEAKE
jgi:hypothetical protein